jgi:glycosyltransferase involved in cell wall biosynthesis
MHVGTAFPHKNLRRLIKAFGIIRQQQPGLKLLLVGKQEHHSKKLQKWTEKLDYSDDVIFTGFVPDRDLKWLYENAACYVFPSLSEGFGLPGLEAMVHGCPVASSDATCLPEVYGDAAHYFDPENVEDMATKVLEVINRPSLRASLIKSGHAQAKKFSWRKMSEETLAVYGEILSLS